MMLIRYMYITMEREEKLSRFVMEKTLEDTDISVGINQKI